MGLWAFRKPAYKLGMFMQHCGFLLCLVGFCLPFWFYASPSAGAQGLWQYCNGRCSELEVAEDWFQMVRALLCIAFIAYLVACVLALYNNCLFRYDPLSYRPSRLPEILTAIIGLVGAACIGVYTIKMKMDYTEYPEKSFGVGYAITGGGCCVTLLSSLFMLASGTLYTPVQTV